MEKKQKGKLLKSATSFNMFIPQIVEEKIRHLCSVIHDVEWSGILFYKCEGSIEEKNLKIICVDILVMDIGSSGYTEFNDTADVITFRVDNNLLGEDIQEGLIHSHNNMATFFSTTDLNTLEEEGKNSNHFVSLIVNNEGDYTAAFTRRVITDSVIKAHIQYLDNKYYNSYNDTKVTIEENITREEDKEQVIKDEFVEYFMLDVEKTSSTVDFSEIDDRLQEIRRSKNRIVVNTNKYKTNTQSTKPYYKEIWDEYDEYDNYNSPYNNFDYYNYNNNKNYTVEDNKNTYKYFLEESLVKKLSLQILTSCVIVNDKLDLNKWINKIDKVYEDHFGNLNNCSKLKEWFEYMIEFIVYSEAKEVEENPSFKANGSDIDVIEEIAKDLHNYLLTLPSSKVKTIINNVLLTYITYGTV